MVIYAFRFQTVCGLRPGEIAGLRNADIQGDVISISRAINQYKEVTNGKNENATRSYVLPELAMSILEDQKKMLKQRGLISAYIFPGKDGDFFKQQTYYERWCRYRDHNKISPNRTPYELRHTFVSVNKSVPAPLLKALVGHSKDMDTFGVYGHAMENEAKETAKLVNDAFQKILSS